MLWNGVAEQTAPKSGYEDADEGDDVDVKIEMVFQPSVESYLKNKFGSAQAFYEKVHPYAVALAGDGYIDVIGRDSDTITVAPKLKVSDADSIEKWVRGVKRTIDEINLYVV